MTPIKISRTIEGFCEFLREEDGIKINGFSLSAIFDELKAHFKNVRVKIEIELI